jgi:hypothetical protein
MMFIGLGLSLGTSQSFVEAELGVWILALNAWNDAGLWDDAATWND